MKFKDADLLGMPIRVTVGNALAKEGVVELRERGTRADRRVPKAEVVATRPGDGASACHKPARPPRGLPACGGPFPVLKS